MHPDAVEETPDSRLPIPPESPAEAKGANYIELARQLAKQHAGQVPTLGYHVHWIYSHSR